MERDEIREALLKAYEAGWRGSLELKEEYAEEALNDLLGPEEKKKIYNIKEEQQELGFDWTIQTNTGAGDVLSGEWVANRGNWATIEIPEV